MSKWVKNISFSLWGKVFAMLFLMLLDISAARILDVSVYAEWVYFFSVLTMLFYVGWMGINTSVKVHVSKCIDVEEKKKCLVAAISLRMIVSILVMILIVLVMPKISYILGYPEKYPDLKWLLTFSGILVFFNSFTEFFKEYFIGVDKFKKLFAITVTEYAGYFIFSLIGLLIFKDIRAIGIGYAISGAVVGIVGGLFVYCENKDLSFDRDNTYKDNIKSIFKYAIPIAVTSFGGLILVEMDTFMMGLLGTKEDVAIYSIAKNLCSKATHLNYSIAIGVMTTFAVITHENYSQRMRQFKKASRLNWTIAIIVALLMFVFGNLAIKILYGNSYIRAGEIIKQLVVYYVLYVISNFYSNFLDFRNKAVIRSVCFMSVIIINFVLNCLWIPQYGASGAAIATDVSLIPYTVMVVVVTNMEWKRLRTSCGMREENFENGKIEI